MSVKVAAWSSARNPTRDASCRDNNGRKAVYRVIYLRPLKWLSPIRITECSRSPRDLCISRVYPAEPEWDERGCVTVPPVRDTARFIETRCGKCVDICMSRAARKRSKNRPIRKIKERRRARSPARAMRCDSRTSERASERSSRGAINRRKQSLIFWNFNSQSVKRTS